MIIYNIHSISGDEVKKENKDKHVDTLLLETVVTVK